MEWTPLLPSKIDSMKPEEIAARIAEVQRALRMTNETIEELEREELKVESDPAYASVQSDKIFSSARGVADPCVQQLVYVAPGKPGGVRPHQWARENATVCETSLAELQYLKSKQYPMRLAGLFKAFGFWDPHLSPEKRRRYKDSIYTMVVEYLARTSRVSQHTASMSIATFHNVHQRRLVDLPTAADFVSSLSGHNRESVLENLTKDTLLSPVWENELPQHLYMIFHACRYFKFPETGVSTSTDTGRLQNDHDKAFGTGLTVKYAK
ncbi:hypothetical protein EJ08DRAFT_46811 [Tothia fuscella]|uniref:Uncharacterized protein n=1 Tax=Tothia fuscella TaxID=1048955 RepID=A0A9P4NFS7_9PEZI|nr:hypothetical protein EJ08DRAFT_46811 [Tothia fuscella]